MRSTAVLFGLAAICLLADDGPKGIPARPLPSDYAAQAEWKSGAIGASIVPPKQVEHLFAFDISKTYLVFEVACYANDKEPLKVSREAFVIKVNASGDAIHHAEPDTVASAIQRQNQPPMPSVRNKNIGVGAEVGYEHGVDPVTGRRVNGVYTGAEVGVGADNGRSSPPDPVAKPGGTYEDRRMLEAQLTARSLPDGPVDHAVAGYLFFRKSDLKIQPDKTYALEYLADQDDSGGTRAITISVPLKSR